MAEIVAVIFIVTVREGVRATVAIGVPVEDMVIVGVQLNDRSGERVEVGVAV